MTDPSQVPSPTLFFETISAFHRSAALKAALDLGVFTAIGSGNTTVPALASACQAAERGIRILCDNLVLMGFLTKTGETYGLTPDTALFLDQNSPAYLGGATEFMCAPLMVDIFRDLAATVRKGGTTLPDQGSVTPDNPIWVQFARAMAPMMQMPAQIMAQRFSGDTGRKARLLDIAAGHGLFGIAFAQQNPHLEVVALDWPHVLEVAQENAAKRGVADRHHLLPGSAFEVEFGSGYDIVLLTNFLHHFDVPTNEGLLRKVHAALAEGGRAITLDFIPNEDRVSPPGTAGFSLIMLASTPHGDAYTFREFDSMFRNAGFARSELHPLQPGMEQAIVSYK